MLKYISFKQVNIETSKELVEKKCYSVIAALVIRVLVAKLEETNEEYFENIILSFVSNTINCWKLLKNLDEGLCKNLISNDYLKSDIITLYSF